MDLLSIMLVTAMLCICAFMIFWNGYNDGVIGRLFLCITCVGCLLAIIPFVMDGPHAYISTIPQLVINAGIVGFQFRHMWRRRFRLTGKTPKRRSTDTTNCTCSQDMVGLTDDDLLAAPPLARGRIESIIQR